MVLNQGGTQLNSQDVFQMPQSTLQQPSVQSRAGLVPTSPFSAHQRFHPNQWFTDSHWKHGTQQDYANNGPDSCIRDQQQPSLLQLLMR